MHRLFVFSIVGVLLLSGCFGVTPPEPGNPGPTIEEGLRKFEDALNIAKHGFDESKAKVLATTYNEPSNPFWGLTLWYLVDRYIFKSWTVSESGSDASVILKYTYVESDTGEESALLTKDFSMRKFDDGWRVDLSEFTNLD